MLNYGIYKENKPIRFDIKEEMHKLRQIKIWIRVLLYIFK